MSTRVLIAGCGYVGSELARLLVDDGDTVYALTRSSRVEVEGVTAVHADLTVVESLKHLPDRLDAIVFTAGSDEFTDDAYKAIYVDGLSNLLRPSAGGGARSENQRTRLVVATSTAVYGQDAGEFVDESDQTSPTRFSGLRMLESESVAANSPQQSILVRFGGIYGPGRTRFLDRIHGRQAPLSNAASYTNRIHRDDCAGVLRHLLRYPNPAPVYLGVDHEPADRNDVIRWISKKFDIEPPSVPEDCKDRVTGKRCSNHLLLSTGYRFRYPTFREGYEEMIDAMRSRAAGIPRS